MALKQQLKQILRRIFELGQRFKVDILPRHFYSEIPSIPLLRSTTAWRRPLSMDRIAGADIPSVVKRIYPDLQNVEEILQDLQSGLPKLELLLQREVAERCHSAFLGNPFQIGIPLAFLVLFDLEIQDLVVLLEAKSNHVPVEKYKDFLIKEMQ